MVRSEVTEWITLMIGIHWGSEWILLVKRLLHTLMLIQGRLELMMLIRRLWCTRLLCPLLLVWLLVAALLLIHGISLVLESLLLIHWWTSLTHLGSTVVAIWACASVSPGSIKLYKVKTKMKFAGNQIYNIKTRYFDDAVT